MGRKTLQISRRSGMTSLIVVPIAMVARVREVSEVGRIGQAEGIVGTWMDMIQMRKAMEKGVTEATKADGGRGRAEGT